MDEFVNSVCRGSLRTAGGRRDQEKGHQQTSRCGSLEFREYRPHAMSFLRSSFLIRQLLQQPPMLRGQSRFAQGFEDLYQQASYIGTFLSL